MGDSSYLGCAVRSDGTLKDASEIEWEYDVDEASPKTPIPPVASTSLTPPNIHPFFTGHPAPATGIMAAGSRRSARTLRPSARILDPNNAMNKPAAPSSAPTTLTRNPSANYKRKAPPSPPSRRVALKVDTDSSNDSGDEYNGDTSIAELSSQPCESSDAEQMEHWPNEYEVLQSMADADHQVCVAVPSNIVIF
jgi:hypothetical protein